VAAREIRIELPNRCAVCYSRRMEPTTAALIEAKISAVNAVVISLNAKISNGEINDLEDAQTFLEVWLESMRALAK
jgi:hypothetical protein